MILVFRAHSFREARFVLWALVVICGKNTKTSSTSFVPVLSGVFEFHRPLVSTHAIEQLESPDQAKSPVLQNWYFGMDLYTPVRHTLVQLRVHVLLRHRSCCNKNTLYFTFVLRCDLKNLITSLRSPRSKPNFLSNSADLGPEDLYLAIFPACI